jgi:hypothetical protein
VAVDDAGEVEARAEGAGGVGDGLVAAAEEKLDNRCGRSTISVFDCRWYATASRRGDIAPVRTPTAAALANAVERLAQLARPVVRSTISVFCFGR